MHPDIAAVMSNLMYQGELATPERRWPRRDTPALYWLDPGGRQESAGTSYCNNTEVEALVDLYQQERRASKKTSIMVITFYKAQLRLIEPALVEGITAAGQLSDGLRGLRLDGGHEEKRPEKREKENAAEALKKLDPAVTVCTVDSCQGSEADVVIVSCVRTGRDTGFVADERRMNVALTRARHLLAIIGSRETFGGAGSSLWRHVVNASDAPDRPLPPPPPVLPAFVASKASKSRCCFQFRDEGSCLYGDRCRFAHVPGGSPGSQQRSARTLGSRGRLRGCGGGSSSSSGVCFQFRNGMCRYGDRCRFSHSRSGVVRRPSPRQLRAAAAHNPVASWPPFDQPVTKLAAVFHATHSR
jgi:hypothetical protein